MGYKKRKSKHAARVDHQNEILKVIQLFEKYPLLTSNARARYSVFLHCFKNRDSLSYEGLVEAKSKLQDMRDIAPATPSPLWPWLRHRPRWLQPRDGCETAVKKRSAVFFLDYIGVFCTANFYILLFFYIPYYSIFYKYRIIRYIKIGYKTTTNKYAV